MLEIKDLTLRLRQNDRVLAEHVTFTLERGDKAVLIGEEGNGKSTLLAFLADERLVADYCDAEGRVVKRGRAAYLPQWLHTPPGQMVADFLAAADAASHIDVLIELGLPPEWLEREQAMDTLSGGERVKLHMARLLMEQPDMLLLDEPTNDLDAGALLWMQSFLRRTRLPVLYISHDEELIEKTANVILHMEQLGGKSRCRLTVAHTGYRDYVQSRRAMFDKQAQVAQKQRDEQERRQEKWQKIHDRVEYELRGCSRQNPGAARLLKKKMRQVLSQERRFEREADNFVDFPEEEDAIITKFDPAIRLPAGKVIADLSLPQLCAGERVLARQVRLFVRGGAHVGITGANGAGKSTLLRAVWEALRERRDITAAYMPQTYAEVLDERQTPVEYLAANHTREDVTRARIYMGSMRFTREEMTGRIGALSGGQQAKLLFLDMVLSGADVLLLDEPTRNFSPLSAPVVRAALREFGGAIISVSHDRRYLREVCDVVYELTEEGLTVKTDV